MDQSSELIKALNVVIRAHQNELDALSKRLMATRTRQVELETEISSLKQRRDREGLVELVESAPFVAGFLNAVAAQQAVLTEQLSDLEREALVLEEQVRDKFVQMKTWTVSLDRIHQANRLAQQHIEEADIDEIGRNVFLRARS